MRTILLACVNSLNRFPLLFVGVALSGILMAFVPAAMAQTEKVLYSFSGNSTGAVSSVFRDSAGNLYGTTLVGGSAGNGAVFKVSPTGTETILYSFSPSAQDGANPEAGLIQDSAGNLYGTTAAGGSNFKNGGTVFKIDSAGNFVSLHTFDPMTFPQNGVTPRAGVIIDSAGNLYGTTFSGGNNGFGTVFKLDPTGNITVLYSFTGGAADGANPRAALVRDSAGNFYGTTLNGGSAGYGIVFKVDSTGLETVLHSFTGTNGDGANPQSALVLDSSGNLYGTTLNGGTAGYGIVFKVDPTGLETVLHSFTGTNSAIADGATPEAGLLQDSAGNLYGTTVHGGAKGGGTIFKLDSTGVETVLYSFTGADGSQPQTSLIQDSAGILYGTTWLGGANGGGAIFTLDSTGKETVLFSFAGLNGDGLNPQGGLVRDSAGNLYGTTPQGGTTVGNCDKYCGTIFKVDPTGKKAVLYYFTGTAGDGAQPMAGLMMDPAGNLYGTTYSGGSTASFGYGTIFKLDTAGHETVLYDFKGGPNDGANPQAGLIQDSKGNLYGTTVTGGVNEFGTVFKLDPSGHETVLHSFGGGGATIDGQYPKAGLILDKKGNLYGTTSTSSSGGGAVFKLQPNGKYTVLHTFGPATGDGTIPLAALIQDSTGNLYGTTAAGGGAGGCLYDSPGSGCGTVFKVDRAGVETVLYSFTGTNGDGAHPEAGLIMDSAGNLYGTTAFGGANGFGTIFKLDPTGHETVLYSFTGPTTGAGPVGIIMDSAGNFYGITTSGGTLSDGTVFVFTP